MWPEVPYPSPRGPFHLTSREAPGRFNETGDDIGLLGVAGRVDHHRGCRYQSLRCDEIELGPALLDRGPNHVGRQCHVQAAIR